MRTSGIVVVIPAIATLALVLFLVAGNRSAADSSESARIETLESEIRNIRRQINELGKVDEITGERAAVSDEPGSQSEPDRPGGSGAAPEPACKEGFGGNAEKPITAPRTESEHFRQIIREEIRNMEEEKKKKLAQQRKAMQPEEWEKKEFGNLAVTVRRMGLHLGLTDNQKRQYYTIMKEDGDSIQGLYVGLKDQNPGIERKELNRMYRERMGELRNYARDLVTGILNAGQREKYEKLCKENEWFK
ncbi:MAG: hypothetical protein E3J72_21995 [Planctomycetota bacterium]|nr:MAG: hypothetical protein E3J72_21995 [Planctomycetota bacterium]